MRKKHRNSAWYKKLSFYSVILLAAVIVIVSISISQWWSQNLKPVSDSEQTRVFVIEQGMNAKEVAHSLENNNFIRNAKAFEFLCKLEKADTKLMAGVYNLAPSMSSREILEVLLKGPVPDVVRVTIPEGYTLEEIIDLLVANGLGTKQEFYQAMLSFNADDYEFLKEVPITEKRLEGFLFPDTYFFAKDSEPKAILAKFLDRFEKELTEEALARLKQLNISIYTWVTKASIVEREAAKAEERPIIAGVFENRLNIGMALESCATVQYILNERKPVLSLEDIAIDSPYNTYKYSGLPPGPIANPGHASLNAVLYPAQTKYLFFVAKNDGSHAFAATFEEHLQNVRKYQ